MPEIKSLLEWVAQLVHKLVGKTARQSSTWRQKSGKGMTYFYYYLKNLDFYRSYIFPDDRIVFLNLDFLF